MANPVLERRATYPGDLPCRRSDVTLTRPSGDAGTPNSFSRIFRSRRVYEQSPDILHNHASYRPRIVKVIFEAVVT